MADNTTINAGTGGDTIASDDIGGVKHQRVKVQHGADGSATDVSTASPLPVTHGTVPSATTMQSAATANGNGTSLTVNGYATAAVNITASVAMSGGTTINFEASVDDTTWVSILGQNVGTNTTAVSTTATGDWVFNVAGYKSLRARISAYSAGTITVKGYSTLGASIPTFVRNDPTGTTTQPISAASLPLPSGAGTSAKQDTIIGHLDGVEGLLTTIDADTSALAGAVSGTEMQVDVLTSALPSGAATSAKQDTQITAEQAIQTSVELIDDVVKAEDVASANADKGVVIHVKRSDTPGNTSGTDGDYEPLQVSGGRLWVDASGKTLTVDGSGVTQPVSHAALTELAAAINSDKVDVNIASGAAAGTEYTEDAAAAANPVGGALILVREDGRAGSLTTTDGDNVAARGNNKGEMYVKTTDSDALLTTIDADTSNISTKIDTIAGAISGSEAQVDVVTSALPTGAATSAKQDTAQTALDAIKTATEVIDNAISGSEMQVDVVGALPAGTNAIGKLAANSGVDIGDVDVTSLPSLVAGTAAIGKILPPDVDVTTHTNYAKKYYTNAGAVTDGIVWSPAAGKRWHVVSMFINVSAAATVTFEDDKSGGDEAVMKMELAANSGVAYNFSEMYPLSSGEDAADLIVTTSAGNVYITVTGYEI